MNDAIGGDKTMHSRQKKEVGMPTHIGKYEIIKILGKGGMGTVFLGRDTVLDRVVAIKVIKESGDVTHESYAYLHQRFLREAQAMVGLQHDNIVSVYDASHEDGLSYITMEYVQGYTLRQLIKQQGNLPLADAVNYLSQICIGLSVVHKSAQVHRDIKPANIMVTPQGQIKIMDFGLVHVEDSNITKINAVTGTPNYMSPEQIHSPHSIDQRSDIFCLGSLFYEMLAGEKAFPGYKFNSVSWKITREQPPLLSNILPFLPQDTDLVLQKCLAKRPNERYTTCDDLLADLTLLVQEEKAIEQEIKRELETKVSDPDIPHTNVPNTNIPNTNIPNTNVINTKVSDTDLANSNTLDTTLEVGNRAPLQLKRRVASFQRTIEKNLFLDSNVFLGFGLITFGQGYFPIELHLLQKKADILHDVLVEAERYDPENPVLEELSGKKLITGKFALALAFFLYVISTFGLSFIMWHLLGKMPNVDNIAKTGVSLNTFTEMIMAWHIIEKTIWLSSFFLVAWVWWIARRMTGIQDLVFSEFSIVRDIVSERWLMTKQDKEAYANSFQRTILFSLLSLVSLVFLLPTGMDFLAKSNFYAESWVAIISSGNISGVVVFIIMLLMVWSVFWTCHALISGINNYFLRGESFEKGKNTTFNAYVVLNLVLWILMLLVIYINMFV